MVHPVRLERRDRLVLTMIHAYSWIINEQKALCGKQLLNPNIIGLRYSDAEKHILKRDDVGDIDKDLNKIDCIPCLRALCKYLESGWSHAAKAHEGCGACDDD